MVDKVNQKREKERGGKLEEGVENGEREQGDRDGN